MSKPDFNLDFSAETLAQPLKPALVCSLGSGAFAWAAGNFTSIYAAPSSFRIPIAAGIQGLGVGFTFYYLRSTALRVWNRPDYTVQEHLLCSTAAGAVTGALNSIAVSRIRVGFVPNVLILSSVGLLGETAYQYFPKLERKRPNPSKKPLTQRILEAKWFPVQRLPEGKFEAMLREKYASTEAEISEIDSQIAALEASRKDAT